MNAPLFDRAAILDHLTELNTALAQQHAERVDLLVVGGSYLALRGLRAGTRDIDTADHLDVAAKLAIATVAEQRSLPAHWLNDSARPFYQRTSTTHAPRSSPCTHTSRSEFRPRTTSS